MNCLAHAYRFLHDPYLAAGTCVPDWLSMADRKTRVRRHEAERFLDGSHSTISTSLVRGILQHLSDDDWFHVTPVFSELNQWLSRDIALVLATEDGHRSGFLAHILVEMLLDSALAEELPGMLDDYYRVMAAIDIQRLQRTVNDIARRPTAVLPWFMQRYMQERFLYDYLEDRPLLRRLNGVMRRVGLPMLPDDLLPLIRQAREAVRGRRVELLTPSSRAIALP